MRYATLVAALVLVAVGSPAFADTITVDEIVYPELTVSVADFASYSGTVVMTYDSGANQLTIVLTNTSANNSGIVGADNLLTGIGFNLGGTLAITGGTANMTGSTAVGFTFPSLGDVSKEWGYDTDPLASGALLDQATGSYTESVSSMESQTTSQFESGSIAQPVNLDGPDFGLVSTSYLGSLGSGVEGIEDSITIVLNLSGTYSGDLLGYIEKNDVALTFGSPTTSPGVVPEPGTVVLLGAALGAGLFFRRRRSR